MTKLEPLKEIFDLIDLSNAQEGEKVIIKKRLIMILNSNFKWYKRYKSIIHLKRDFPKLYHEWFDNDMSTESYEDFILRKSFKDVINND